MKPIIMNYQIIINTLIFLIAHILAHILKAVKGALRISEHKPLTGNFVLTTAVKRSFEMVLMAASQKWPVLLYGPAGSGKTALINDLALKSGSRAVESKQLIYFIRGWFDTPKVLFNVLALKLASFID
ncbi:uncharacterized protein LOC110113134 [Dendrobium catenatum]|uniref:uncharacterized protein LOC110113134 n=1 Tax=Dendrobium catenatum TaxID=906689 RepID=UPI0009F2993A|nr:uncharacterized protein LOC110113134 [Dendrobium catenatum]